MTTAGDDVVSSSHPGEQNARLLGATRVVGSGRSQPGLERAAAAGTQTAAITGDAGTDAEALAKLLDGDPPGLVLDSVWEPSPRPPSGPWPVRGPGRATPASSTSRSARWPGPRAAVPSALLRRRKLTISGSGSVAAADIKAQIPAYIQLITDGSVQVPLRTFPLSDAGAAWTASAESGPRVVLVRDQAG